MEFLIFIFNYCTDFVINLANLFNLSYYEVNAFIFCLGWPLITISLIILYLIKLRKVKKLITYSKKRSSLSNNKHITIMRIKSILFWVSFLVFLTYSSSSCKYKRRDIKELREEMKFSKTKISILPLGNINKKTVQQIFNNLQKLNNNVELLETISLPAFAFYSPRNRYRADSLIAWFSRKAHNDEIVIGITNSDISTTNKDRKSDDWGVMGLGFCPGNACIASDFRLKDKSGNSLFKVVIHEIGHTEGLLHCNNKECYMRDAEGGDTTAEEKGFCTKCSMYLKNKGWNF